MKNPVLIACACAAILVTAAAAQRVPAPPAYTVQTRQHNYKQMAAAMKGINEQLRSSSPSLAEIRPRTALIATYAVQLLRWFPHGTGPETGLRMRALPNVWSDRATFTQRGAALLVAARRLDQAAQGGDLAAVRAAVPEVGRACSACHDDFRAPEH